MLTRAAFGLTIALASVSGSLAAPPAHAINTHTVYIRPCADVAGPHSRSESAPTVWGWPYVPPQAPAHW
jgi:hypothetical protein